MRIKLYLAALFLLIGLSPPMQSLAGDGSVVVTPPIYVIDQAGRLAYMGGIDSITTFNPKGIPRATQYVRAALDELTAEKQDPPGS